MSLKLASGSYDNTVRFWDPSTNNNSEIIKLDSAAISLQIAEKKDKIVAGMYNAVKVVDINKPNNPVRSIDGVFKGNVNAVGYLGSNEGVIYTACDDGSVRLFDLKAKNVVKEYKNGKPINCAVLHPNKSSIIFGDEGGVITKWDLNKDNQHKTTLMSQKSVRTITMSDSLQRMAFGNNDGFVTCYGQHLAQKNKPVKVHDEYILKIKISPNNRYLATCSADKKIKLFKINVENDNFNIVQHRTLKGHLKWVWDCQFSCDQAYLITCSTDQTIKLWDVERGELVQTLKGHEKGVISLALNDIAD